MNKRIAILDLGTNTFHLLIADVKPDFTFESIFKAEEFVQLGEEGLDHIGDRAFLRGIDQLKKFREVIEKLMPQQVIGFGTAAIRSANNGDAFISLAKECCPMELHKISGDREAEFIYRGVRQAANLSSDPVMIMDIGGGSTEFIIANHEKIFWKQSFPLGASVLKRQFHSHEPISAIEQVKLLSYLQHELSGLIALTKEFSVHHLIGAAGSFDTLAQIIHENFGGFITSDPTTEIALADFYRLCEILLRSTQEERLQIRGLIWFRSEMMVVAAILTAFVVESCGIRRVTRSAYALKEGVLWSLIHE